MIESLGSVIAGCWSLIHEFHYQNMARSTLCRTNADIIETIKCVVIEELISTKAKNNSSGIKFSRKEASGADSASPPAAVPEVSSVHTDVCWHKACGEDM